MRHDHSMLVPQDAMPGQPGRAKARERGFILIVVVGMLAVLVVLGMSYAEQGRVELRGASNTRDLAALDGLSESGFQLALRALRDDRNVKHATSTPSHLTTLGGIGYSSRWGYNPDPTLNGAMPTGADKAPSRTDPANFQDTWRMLFWNEETVEPVATWTGAAWGYGFKFRPGTDDEAKRSMETQRFPQPSSVLLDTVQLQPFARSRKFRIRVGSSFGLIQVGISPKDGGVNLNDVYAPGTADESPGIYETLPSGVAAGTRTWQEGTKDLAGYDVTADATKMAKVPYASPDRRTLEYILGRAPQFAAKNRETSVYYRYRATSLRLMLSGSAAVDNGLFNWRYAFEPYGGQRATTHAGGPAALWKYDYTYSGGYKLRASTAVMTSASSGAPTTIWNMAAGEPNRFGMESSRHIMWAALKGMAYTADGIYQKPGIGFLVAPGHYGSDDNKDYLWYPTGLWTSDPRLPSADAQMVDGYKKEGDNMFHGFGFDRFNAPRAGIDGSPSAYWNSFYYGPGGYGHPKTRTFQLHFINAVANGRFWTDLLAAWYFGGAPGYTNFLGATQSSGYNNWAHLGSSYDSMAIGTHWMPPTAHVWMPGFFNKGRISTPSAYTTQGGGGISSKAGKDELSRGMTRWPGNMPPVRMAASYLVPMARWPADFVGQSNAHFSYNYFRLSIRAHGLQENWGDPNSPGTVNGTAANNRWYDAIDINNSNFPVVYGLLTAEKLPSLLARTTVAPHLHWKSRMLDSEVRLRRPVKIDGSAEPYNDVTNSWIPVALALRNTDTAKKYPGGDWDGDPDSANYNPWVPLRMKLNDPNVPWHPTNNPWIEPKLRDKTKPFDPISNPFYNSAAFLNDLATDANVRNDYIKYPWMPNLKKPVEVNAGTGNPEIDPTTNEAIIRYGLYDFANATLLAQPAGTWSTWIQDTGLPENFPYMPIDAYGANPTWRGPGPFDGGGAAYPSPGWDGYCFEPRWYTGRTVNPLYLLEKLVPVSGGGNADKPSIAEVAAFFTIPGHNNGALSSTLHSDAAKSPPNAWDFTAHKNFSGGLGALTYHRHIDPAAGRRNVIWGKMDFLTPEPKEYYDLNGDVVGYGTGRPQDDVFLDTRLDLSLQEMALTDTDQTYASAMARPDSFRNYPEWFSQRKRAISADSAGVDRTQAPFRPITNDVNGTLYWRNKDPNWGWGSSLVKDGKVFENTDSSGTNQFDTAISSLPSQQRTRKVRGTTQNRGYW
ncbi:MAG: hypothetical protein L6R28_25380 [Planctomycetes bacterium]|nr:hypothetical protein [Planctomycetota bacterium]